MISRRSSFFGFAAITLCAAFAFGSEALAQSAPPGPVAIVRSIYQGAGAREMAFGLDPAERKRFLSKSTLALWEKAEAVSNPHGDEVGAVDFDIPTNSQGAELKSYSIVSSEIGPNRATVVVKVALDNWIRHSPEDDVLRYHFVLEDGRWMIADIAGHADGKPWTLLEILEVNSRDHTRAKE
jgi:hypothetical protein